MVLMRMMMCKIDNYDDNDDDDDDDCDDENDNGQAPLLVRPAQPKLSLVLSISQWFAHCYMHCLCICHILCLCVFVFMYLYSELYFYMHLYLYCTVLTPTVFVFMIVSIFVQYCIICTPYILSVKWMTLYWQGRKLSLRSLH